MAIIKAKKYLGSDPYWWVIKEVREDRLNNNTQVILCLYADPNIAANEPNNYISQFPTAIIPGIGLSNDDLIAGFLTQNSNNPDWKGAVNTDNSYSLDNVKSQIYQQISNDPNNGVIRFAEIVDYRHFCKNNILLMNLAIYFDTITFEEDGITPIINTDVTKFVADTTKTQVITWVVDNFYKVSNTTIGEFDYFMGLVNQGIPLFTVLSQGLAYGDNNGNINSKLQ